MARTGQARVELGAAVWLRPIVTKPRVCHCGFDIQEFDGEPVLQDVAASFTRCESESVNNEHLRPQPARDQKARTAAMSSHSTQSCLPPHWRRTGVA